MKKILIAALILLATPSLAGPADKLALLQSKTIFRSGLRATHTVALTFDDGPNVATLGVLKALKDMNVKATFFIVGKMAKAHPDVLAAVAAGGHLLGNHSSTHPMLTKRYDANPQLLLNQLRVVDQQISPLMQAGDIKYFRAPYGYWRPAHAALLNADPVLRNYVGPIYWDIGGDISMKDGYVLSSADWDCWAHHWSAEVCAKGYIREIRRKDGGVVLMHSINKNAEALVRAVVPVLKEEGYTFVRLDQVPEYKQFETPDAGAVASNAKLLQSAALLAGRTVK